MRVFTFAAVLMAGICVQAGVSIHPQAYYVYADKGGTLLPTASLIAWVADSAGDGFGDWSGLAPDTFLADPDDDVLLGIGPSGNLGAGIVEDGYSWSNVTSPDVQGANFTMLWFNTPYTAGATGAGAGVSFGIYETGEPVPNDGSSEESYLWATLDAGGLLPNDTFHTTQTTIPEPTSILLCLLGFAGWCAASRPLKRRTAAKPPAC